jgi:hypothetical protein
LDDLRCTIAKSIVDYKAQPNCHLSFVICQLKKRRQLKTLFVILILSLVSCRDENEPMPVTREAGDGLVRFSYTLSGAGVTTRFTTTEAGGNFTPNDRVGIFMLEHKTANDEGVWDDPYWSETRNIPYKTDAANDLLPVSTSIRYPDDGSPVNFVSYYPYTPDIEQKYNIPVDVSTYTGPLADMGLLVYDGRGVAKQKGYAATFAYAPQLCKLIIVVKPEDGYEDVDLIDAPNLTVRGLPTKAKYNLHLSTMEISTDKTDAGTATDVSLTPVVTSNKDSVRWEALILPHTLSHAATAGRFFTFTLGGKPYEYELKNETFVKGTKYRYDFTLSEPGPKITPQTPTSSFDGMTNCYMVAPGDSVTFRVSRAYTFVDGKFTNKLHVDGSSYSGVNDKFNAETVWADCADLLSSVTVDDGAGYKARVTVRANNTNYVGNAVVKIFKRGDSAKTPVWSYHIWVSTYKPDDKDASDNAVYENTGNTNNNGKSFIFMDRNLGATFAGRNESASSIGTGLFYQWGRKDPFPDTDNKLPYGSFSKQSTSSTRGTIPYTIKNPGVFLYARLSNSYDWIDMSLNDSLWYSADAMKTIYDPCPSGWRVPKYAGDTSILSPWYGIKKNKTSFAYGYDFDVNAIYPATGIRNGAKPDSNGNLNSVGRYGALYGIQPSYSIGRKDIAFTFDEDGVNYLLKEYGTARGNCIRCVRE